MHGEEQPALPVTVAAAHLETCAAALVTSGPDTAGELAEVLRSLVNGQLHIAAALHNLAGKVTEKHTEGPLAAVPSPELTALTEVLRAAANAVGHSAEALVEGEPALDVLLRSAGEDTRL